MTDVQKLREELKKAELLEEKEKKKQELEYYSKYSGLYKHIHLSRGKKKKIEGMCFSRIGDFKRDSIDGRICYTLETIGQADTNNSWQKENSIKYIKQTERIYDSYPSFIRWNRCNLTNPQFDNLIKLVKSRSSEFFSFLQKIEDINFEESELEPDSNLEFDLPYIQFEPHESILFKDSDYMLPGYRYLISRNSIILALNDLREKFDDLHRLSRHFESCDMDYYRSRENSIKTAREKINKIKNF